MKAIPNYIFFIYISKNIQFKKKQKLTNTQTELRFTRSFSVATYEMLLRHLVIVHSLDGTILLGFEARCIFPL